MHEIGHAVLSWINGITAVPTMFKNYGVSGTVPWSVHSRVLFGGVAATFCTTVVIIVWYAMTPRSNGEAVLAGTLVLPSAYTIRWLLTGRGHDGVEWQAAQIVMGADPVGHGVDIAFALLVAAGALVWLRRYRSAIRPLMMFRTIAVIVGGVFALVIFQIANNRLFDRIFPVGQYEISDRPADLDPR